MQKRLVSRLYPGGRRPARGRLRSRHDAREVSLTVGPPARQFHGDEETHCRRRGRSGQRDGGSGHRDLVQASEMWDQAIKMLVQAREMLGDVDDIVDR